MWLVSDVHGAVRALRRVADRGGPLLVLGDLINFIDYRTNAGIVADVSGKELVDRFVRLRSEGRHDEARELWQHHTRGREEEMRHAYEVAIEQAYVEICAALEGCEAYVTFGNVDRPDLLRAHLPSTARFVDAEILEIEGHTVGFAGGGVTSIGTPGEVSDEEMAAKLDALGDVEILCTHVAPAVDVLATDVIGGRQKGSEPVLQYLVDRRPRLHFFGDIHQPRATTWRIGPTTSHNVGYFRATGRAVRYG